MADLNANINVGIETTQALNQLKALQKQISQFHQSVAKSSATASVAQRDLQKNFLNSINSIQGFSAELRTVRTTAESFTNSLEKNKFSMREYFRYAGGATRTFGKNFAAEFSTIEKTAIERVKTLQTQYIKMGRDAQGAMQAIAVRPTVLDMKDLGTQTAIAGQKQALFNQLVKQGSTNLLNFGKNTQWAGRQLMVGFTLPLATLGMTAGRVFFDMEKAALKFKKVYGDLFTAPEETKQAMESIVELGQAYAAYGIAVSDSLSIAADAAAAGFAGVDLQNQTSAALKLSVLGQLDLQKALETTISLQNAFQLSSADLAGEIDFLNAVENQTVVSLDDITEATPRVAPVIKQLGGNVRDLAFFLAAMKEGGVNAAQGANALKSGLASLINPSEKSAGILNTLGINIKAIVEGNQGDIAGTVTTFAKALDELDPLKRAQAIEQLFGKFQFARISALFDNITREGTQAQRVLELAGSTAAELASLSESELGVSAASSMNKFRKAIEQIKVALVPIGELFVQIATPFVEFGTEMLKAFNKLPDGVKTVIGTVITILGGIGPIALMTFGLINNGIANMIKFFATVRMGYLKITGQAKGIADETQYMTQEQLEAAAAAASLDQAHAGLTQRFTAERAAVDQLRIAYERAAEAGNRFTLNNPQMIKPGFKPTGFAAGGIVGGSGNKDTIPAMLTPGEFVVKKDVAQKMLPILEAMNAGKLPGFNNGGPVGKVASSERTDFAHVTDRMTVTIAELVSALSNGTGKISQAMMNTVQDLQDTFGPDLKAHIYSGLGFSQDSKLNIGMRDGGAVPAADFAADFESKGPEKWSKSIRLGGAKMDEVAAELAVYDSEIAKGVQAMVAQNKNATITSEQFALLEKEVRESIPATSKLREALDAAEKGLYQFRVNPTAEDAANAGLESYQVPSSADPTKMSAKSRVRTSQGRELRLGGNKFERSQPLAGVQLSEFNDSLQESAETNSESRRTKQIAKDTVDGYANELERGKPKVEEAAKETVATVTQATKNSAAQSTGSSFGNINTKEPVAAVGNAPRQAAQAMSQESVATKTFASDVKASFANARANITRELGFVKEEFASIVQQIKQSFGIGGQEIVQVAETTNEGLLINGKQYSMNYIAQAQGRDGAIEAIATKKTAELISNVTSAWNSGVREIPPIIPREMSKAAKQIESSAENFKRISVDNEIERQKALANVQGGVGNVAATATAAVGDLPAQKVKMSFEEISQKASNVSMALAATSGLLSMFGGQLSQITGPLSLLSSGIFALIQITQALVKVQMIKAALDRAGLIIESYKAAISAMATAGTLTLGTAAFATGGAIWAMLGPIGLVVAGLALLAGGFLLFNHLAEESRKKIAGLGNAATAAGEKLKLIADLAGFEPTRDPGQAFDEATIGVGADATRTEQQAAVAVKDSDQFKEAIADGGILKADLDALKGAGDNAKIALETLTANLIALAPDDADPEKIKAVVLALAAEAGLEEVEVNLPMNLNPFVVGNENAVQDFVAGITKDISANEDNQFEKNIFGGRLDALTDAGESDANQLGAAAFAGVQQLQTALEAGNLTTLEYDQNIKKLFSNFETLDPTLAAAAGQKIMESFGVPPEVAAGIKDLEAQQAVIQGLSVGITPNSDQLKAISKIDSGSEADRIAAEKILADLRIETAIATKGAADAADALAEAEAKKKAEVDLGLIQDEVDANNAKLEQAQGLIDSGMDEADAMAIAKDEKFANIFATAKLADEQNAANGVTVEGATEVQKAKNAYEEYKNSIEAVNNATQASNLAEWIKNAKEEKQTKKDLKIAGFGAADAQLILNNEMLRGAFLAADTDEKMIAYKKTVEEFKRLGGADTTAGGGSKADPIGDAIKDLKKQRKEIINTSKAYSALSKSGMSAVRAFEFAQNPALMSAMNAGLKVGSKQWDEIIKRIKAAEAATNKWRRSTVQGQTEVFGEAYEKASRLFSLEEESLQQAFDKRTKADNTLIKSLEAQIEGLNDQISGYSRSLDEIAEKEDKINDSYDKKTKALEQTKRINEDIIRQQKSQLSIADALSQGDVSAAASAIQQARSENAAAALEAQGNQLGLARDAQIAGVKSADGLTRTQIEEKVKGLKKQISDIELGTLKTAQARVAAAEAELAKANENVLVAGRTKVQWDEQKTAIEKAEANAITYTKELNKAFSGAESLRKEWDKLDKDFTTTHRVKTIYTQEGAAPSAKTPIVTPKPANPKTPISSKGGSGVGAAIPFASGGKVGYYPMGGLIPYMANGGMFQSVNTDTVPAMLTPGEFVVRRSAVDKFGLQNLKNINNGTYGNTLSRGFSQPIYPEISRDYASANIGGGIYPSSDVPQSNTQVDNSVYNYSLSVNVEGTDATPDQIANVVMRKLQDFGSQMVKGQVVG